MKAGRLLALGLALSGCGLLAERVPVEIDPARVTRARALEAATRAPGSFARYEAARRAAERERDRNARSLRATEARLWLESAIAEAEQLALSEQRLALERALAGVDAELLETVREQRAIERENELQAVQAIAHSELVRALALAARPAQHARISRAEARAAAETLRARAALIVLAVETAGQGGEPRVHLERELAAIERTMERNPEAALVRADVALFSALALLGQLRERAATPTDAERASLEEALSVAGLSVSRGERGLDARIDGAFRGAALAGPAHRTVARLCALAAAHPHGPVRLDVQATRAAELAARLGVVRRQLAGAGCKGERFRIEAGAARGDDLDVSWLAY